MLTTSIDTDLVAVRDVYEETVMSVPHYAEDYNQTFDIKHRRFPASLPLI